MIQNNIYEMVRGIPFISMTYVVVKLENISINVCDLLENKRPKNLNLFSMFYVNKMEFFV